MARWSDLAEWRGPTPNQGPAMVEHRGLVVHIAQGYYQGTIAYQKDPDVDVSSHFVLAGPRDVVHGVPDGRLAQVVDTDVAAWTQRAGNGHWLSVECSAFVPDKLSAAQVEGVAQLFARCHTAYGVPLQIASDPTGRGLGHHSMGCNWPGGSWGHCDCPGPAIIAQKPLIVARAQQIVEGGLMLCKFGDRGPIVESFQRLMLAVDPTCLPTFGPDGGYGNETVAAAVKLGLGGDGKTYGPAQYAALAVSVSRKYAASKAHDHPVTFPGSSGKTGVGG